MEEDLQMATVYVVVISPRNSELHAAFLTVLLPLKLHSTGKCAGHLSEQMATV